jgi:hypothetical protein
MPLIGAAQQDQFHTEPSCWDEPRIYHSGLPPAELAQRVTIIDSPANVVPDSEAQVSPNSAYRFWVRNPDTSQPGPWGAGIVVDAEQPRHTLLLFNKVSSTISPEWLNEKLVFVRVPWGRTRFTDLIFDVEKKQIIYQEQAIYGENAFNQFKQACGDNCPCEQPAAAEPNPRMPEALPGEDAMIGLLAIPGVFGSPESAEAGGTFQRRPVPVYAAPEQGARKLGEPGAAEDFESMEYTYEGLAAVVYAQRPGWYQVGLADGRRGWISAKSPSEFFPASALLTRRLAYLNEHWNRKVWESPTTYRGWNSKLKQTGTESRVEIPVNILDSRRVGNGLWLQIETLTSSPCEAGQPMVVDRGWIPAYAQSGALVAGYFSRGC